MAIFIAVAFLLSGCGSYGQPKTPIKAEQTNGVYKIYHQNYFKYDEKTLNALLEAWCENNTCKQMYKDTPRAISYIRMMDGNDCKILDSTIEDDEEAEIARLERQKTISCHFVYDMLTHIRGGTFLFFLRDKNGDFINSEFLTLQNGKVANRKLIESTKATALYDKNGNKLLDKAHQNIYFYPKTCGKVLAVDGLKYEILPIAAAQKVPTVNATDKEVEKLLQTKFYLDNKNSSKIKAFAPFGYMMEYGEKFIGTGKHKSKIKVYRLFDKDGTDIFDDIDLMWAAKINDHRLIVRAIKPYTSELETFLYDFDNKKVLFKADRAKQSYESSMTKYDKIVFFKDKKTGIADFDGNIVTDLQSKYDFENTYRGFIVYADGNGIYKRGLLDANLKPVMKDLSKVDFRDNVFIAYAKDRAVVFDYSKNILQDLKADNITAYDNFYIASFNNEGILYDKNWNKLFDKSYKNLKPLDNSIFSYTLEGKTVVMDINAKEIIPPICDKITLNSCNIIECVTN
ncbi:MAG: hypothetical protein LBL65_05790 [Campylobacteraceae bacterium]|jgi:hypothetical protein|nr:hypothetical protein [Campylobacteraceae bacterium]